MHIERNICCSMLGYLLGEKDTLQVWADLADSGIMPSLHLRQRGTGETYLKPHAPYVLRPQQLTAFLSIVGQIRVPTGYSSRLGLRVGERKVQGLKSHDYHVIMQQLLPAAIKGFLQPGPKDAIIRLGHTFQRLCAKVIDPDELPGLKTYATETLCLLERWFPPSFFDIMSHLVVHLVDEVDLCGPVHSRWCYGIERYMYVLKRYVRNRLKPEGSIATGYMYSEALGFLAEHLTLYPGSRRVWDMDNEAREEGEVLEGGGRRRELSDEEQIRIHKFVISNSDATRNLLRYVPQANVIHCRRHLPQWFPESSTCMKRTIPPMSSLTLNVHLSCREYLEVSDHFGATTHASTAGHEPFSKWLEAKVDAMGAAAGSESPEVLILAQPPARHVTEYPSMWAYGNHFRCEHALLGSTHISYDSGVACIVNQSCQSSSHDRNPVDANLKYVGVLRKILVVEYASRKVNVMKCAWVRPDLVGNRKIMKDEHGFWLVKLAALREEEVEPYVFPQHVSQVRPQPLTMYYDDPPSTPH
jgi:hypothetical protein